MSWTNTLDTKWKRSSKRPLTGVRQDLHIKAGDVFRARINGDLVALTKQALTTEQTRSIALHLMNNEDDKARIDTILDYDCSWSAPGHRTVPRES
jgi:Tfp pilus assembly pilus retraction ATPase PilT